MHTSRRTLRGSRVQALPKSNHIRLAQFLTEIPPRYALPPFFKGGQGGICSRSVMKCTNVAWSDLDTSLNKAKERS
jgi:hypothetical protein